MGKSKVMITGKTLYSENEFLLMNKAVNDPDTYRVHTVDEHNDLIRVNGRCVLCIVGSDVVVTREEVVCQKTK